MLCEWGYVEKKKTYLKIGATLLTSTLLIRVDQEGFSKGCPNSWGGKGCEIWTFGTILDKRGGIGFKTLKKIRHRLWMITERKNIYACQNCSTNRI